MAEAAEKQFYEPGEIIHLGKLSAIAIIYEQRFNLCDHCGKKIQKTRLCSKCGYVGYCSKECKQFAKPLHSKECDCLKDPFHISSITLAEIRLVAKVFLMLKQSTDKKLKETVFGKEVSLDDLPMNDKEEKSTIIFLLDLVDKLIGKENLPPHPIHAQEITNKIHFNLKEMAQSFQFIGFSLCIGEHAFSFSCLPNAVNLRKGENYDIRVTKKVAQGDLSKIYLPFLGIWDQPQNMGERKEQAYHHNSKSACTDCSLPYGESILTKILDKTKSEAAIRQSASLLPQLDILNLFEDNGHFRRLVNLCLISQEGVLADTHILRMKLFHWKIKLESDIAVIKEYGEKLIQNAMNVYGGKSYEVYVCCSTVAVALALKQQLKSGKKYAKLSIELCKLYEMKIIDFKEIERMAAAANEAIIITEYLMRAMHIY